ncbi:prepilin peptidase [Gilliamella mensalis]|uniref:prepilin peptidase n=1 Tax=Gilliamella mensalis TaxID=1908520 RepID=UPI000A15E94B|nr:A24 family peptidase [Gilliamella mensalis]
MLMFIIIYLGLCMGSFVHVAYCRYLPTLTTCQYLYRISVYRSACPHCHHRLNAWQLVPVVAWLILKGRCHYCKVKISCRYLIVELFVAALFAIIYFDKGINFQSCILMLLGCYFLLLAFIDFKYYLLPDLFTQPLMWIGIMLAYFNITNIELADALLGIFLGYLLLKIPATLFYLISKKEGLGGGDIKLLAALGAWLPYTLLPLLLFFSSLLGIMYYLFLRYALNQNITKIIPFGPFLLISGYVIYYYL